MNGVRRSEGEPHDRQTRICAAMTDAFDAHPERRPTDKCIVFIQDEKQGGIELHGYKEDTEALVDLLLVSLAFMSGLTSGDKRMECRQSG